jgi:hypothetical protein
VIGAGLVLAAGAVATLLATLVVYAGAEWLVLLPEKVAQVLTEVDKTSLHPFRLLSILALAYLLGHLVPRDAAWVRSAPALPFVLMGQHGLPVFCSGIFLSFLGRLALELAEGWPMQLAVNLAGLMLLVGVGAIGAWYRLRETAPAARPQPADLPKPAVSLTNSVR